MEIKKPICATLENQSYVKEVKNAKEVGMESFKYEVTLADGVVYSAGNFAGLQSGYFNSVKEFFDSKPALIEVRKAPPITPEELENAVDVKYPVANEEMNPAASALANRLAAPEEAPGPAVVRNPRKPTRAGNVGTKGVRGKIAAGE